MLVLQGAGLRASDAAAGPAPRGACRQALPDAAELVCRARFRGAKEVFDRLEFLLVEEHQARRYEEPPAVQLPDVAPRFRQAARAGHPGSPGE